jgi:hypothetical protein
MQGDGNFVPRTSAYKLRIRTDSADDNALMLLADGELVAILVELADEGHAAERGRWTIEAVFGLSHHRLPPSFDSAADAAAWVTEQVCQLPFSLDAVVVQLD